MHTEEPGIEPEPGQGTVPPTALKHICARGGTGTAHLLRVLSGQEFEVGHGRVLVPPEWIGGAAQEQRRQQLRVDAALLTDHADHHLKSEPLGEPTRTFG